MKILLVEPDEKFRSAALRAFKGHDVAVASDFEEAMAALKFGTFQAVVTGLFVPETRYWDTGVAGKAVRRLLLGAESHRKGYCWRPRSFKELPVAPLGLRIAGEAISHGMPVVIVPQGSHNHDYSALSFIWVAIVALANRHAPEMNSPALFYLLMTQTGEGNVDKLQEATWLTALDEAPRRLPQIIDTMEEEFLPEDLKGLLGENSILALA